jgi:hypothetical protein
MPYQVLQYRGTELVSANALKDKDRAAKQVEKLKSQNPNDEVSIRPLYTSIDGIAHG